MIAILLIFGVVRGTNLKRDELEVEGRNAEAGSEDFSSEIESISEDIISEESGDECTEEAETETTPEIEPVEPEVSFDASRFFRNEDIPPLNGKEDKHQCLLLNEGVCIVQSRLFNPLIAPLEDEKEIKSGRVWNIGTDDAFRTYIQNIAENPYDGCRKNYKEDSYLETPVQPAFHRNILNRCPMYEFKNICCLANDPSEGNNLMKQAIRKM